MDENHQGEPWNLGRGGPLLRTPPDHPPPPRLKARICHSEGNTRVEGVNGGAHAGKHWTKAADAEDCKGMTAVKHGGKRLRARRPCIERRITRKTSYGRNHVTHKNVAVRSLLNGKYWSKRGGGGTSGTPIKNQGFGAALLLFPPHQIFVFWHRPQYRAWLCRGFDDGIKAR